MNGNKAVVAYFVSIQEVSPVNPELLQSDASSVRKTLRIWNDDEGVLYHTICPDMHIPCVQEWRSSILTTGVYPPTLELDSGIPSKTPVLVQNTLSPVNLKVSGSFFDARLYWILTKTLPNGDVQAVCSGEGEVSQTLLLFPGNYTLFAWVEFSHEWPNIEWGGKSISLSLGQPTLLSTLYHRAFTLLYLGFRRIRLCRGRNSNTDSLSVKTSIIAGVTNLGTRADWTELKRGPDGAKP
jgi:hypothetical protein